MLRHIAKYLRCGIASQANLVPAGGDVRPALKGIGQIGRECGRARSFARMRTNPATRRRTFDREGLHGHARDALAGSDA
jgi:hypothetical protein